MKELYEQIKERLNSFEDGEFVLPFDEEIDGFRFGDGEDDYYEKSEMVIFKGNGWFGNEEVEFKKVYFDEDGDLSFDLYFTQWNYKGNVCDSHLMTEVWEGLLDCNCSSEGEYGEALQEEVLESVIKVMDYYKNHIEEYNSIISEIEDEDCYWD